MNKAVKAWVNNKPRKDGYTVSTGNELFYRGRRVGVTFGDAKFIMDFRREALIVARPRPLEHLFNIAVEGGAIGVEATLHYKTMLFEFEFPLGLKKQRFMLREIEARKHAKVAIDAPKGESDEWEEEEEY